MMDMIAWDALNDGEWNLKRINTRSSDFADLRKENVLYVDKTAYMHRMISDEENKVLFISRPRRFGKSLSISALKVDEPVDAAFRQIHEKGYADQYVASGKPIWLVGLSFDGKSRKLIDCAARPFNPIRAEAPE